MATRIVKALGVLACGVLWTTGCAPATIEGTVGDQEYSKIKTAFFDTYNDDYSSFLSLVMYDQDFSCEQLQTAVDSSTAPTTDDSSLVVGYFEVLLAQYNGDYTFSTVSEPGTYKVFDLYDTNDYANAEEGDLIAVVISAFYIDPESPLVYDTAEVGSVTIDKVDLESTVAGSFDVTLADAGTELTGSFKVEPCDFYN